MSETVIIIKKMIFPQNKSHLIYYNIAKILNSDNLSIIISHIKIKNIQKLRIVSKKDNEYIIGNVCVINNYKFYCCANDVSDNIPKHIVGPKFCNIFNETINNFPNSMTHLTFLNGFRRPINKLPNSVKHLRICNIIIKSIKN